MLIDPPKTIAASLLLVVASLSAGCNGDPAPAPVCQNGAPTYPKPVGYGFFTNHNWACATSPAPIDSMTYYVNSFIGVFGAPNSQGFHQTDIYVAATELEDDVIFPARDAWLDAGSSVTNFPYSVDLGPTPAIVEDGDSEVAALLGAMTGVAHLRGAAAIGTRYSSTANPTVTTECDILFFEEYVDPDTSATKSIYWQREVLSTPPTAAGTYGPTYSWALAHELGHCLGLDDQVEEWTGHGTILKDSVMWYMVGENVMATTSGPDRDAVKHLYGL